MATTTLAPPAPRRQKLPHGIFDVDGRPRRWSGHAEGKSIFTNLIDQGYVPHRVDDQGRPVGVQCVFDPTMPRIAFIAVQVSVGHDGR